MDMSVNLTDEQYLDLLLRGQKKAAPRRRFSLGDCIVWVLAAIMFVVFVAALLPNIAASYPGLPVLAQFIATPRAVFSTSLPARQQQPAGVPPQTGAAPWPTLTPEPQEARPTLTLPAAPSPTEGFWSPADETAFAATATAFIEVIPTAPPDFARYVDERCKDAGAVEESATLQLFCKK